MTEAISFFMCVVGVALVCVLYARIRAVDAHIKLKQYRSKEEGLADLLIHAAVVDDGIIVGKNGSLMAAWMYKGEDNGSATDEERNRVAVNINQAFVGMGNGWMVHVDAVRREAPKYPTAELSAFPDPVTAAMDEERRRLFEGLGTMYEGYFVIVITYFPPLLAQRRFVEMMFDDDAVKPDQKARTRGLLDTFKRDIRAFESAMSSAVTLERLKGEKMMAENGSIHTHDNFLRWLQFCITGRNHPVALPDDPMYLDAIIGGQSFDPGVVPRVGRKYIQTVAIDGFPLSSQPGILNMLGELACEYRWSNRFIFMDQHEALAHLEKFRKKWKQKIRGFFDQVFNTNTGSIDQDAISMVDDADAAIAETKSGLIAQGYYTSVVVLMHEDRERVEREARKVEKAINDLGFGGRIEDVNTVEAFLGSIPGHGVENVTRPLLNTLNVAQFIPTSTIWTGEAEAPCPLYPAQSPAIMHCVTHGATPFRLNFHVADLGHGFIFGRTRSGKSTLLGIVAAQLRRYHNMSIYVFEKGMSMYPLTKAVGGLHFDIGGDNDRLSFCPLQFLETKGDRAWAMDWIASIMVLNDKKPTPDQVNDIADAILTMHENGGRTLSEFSNTIQDEEIRAILKPYLADGNMGNLLDASDDGLALSNFTTFEIESLMNLGPQYAMPVLMYLFRRIERSLHGQPAVIILDEAWLMLGHKAFREKIREWLKTMGKANCSVIMATQSMSDAANSDIFDVIVESTATKIFLPNVYAKDEKTAELYTRMGLNPRQIDIIFKARPKKEYYYVSENGRRLFDLALGPLALAIIGRTDKESVAQVKKLEERYGDQWLVEWLRTRSIELADYGVAA